MEAGRNMERINDLIWKLITIWSSNTNIEDRLSMMLKGWLLVRGRNRFLAPSV